MLFVFRIFKFWGNYLVGFDGQQRREPSGEDIKVNVQAFRFLCPLIDTSSFCSSGYPKQTKPFLY